VMIVGGFLWTRGMMGLYGLEERVFALLAYANVIVQGTSFALHKYAAARGATNPVARWRVSQQVDPLIGITGGIALVGFATLYSFPVAPIRELAIASVCGLGGLLVLAVLFLPGLAVLGQQGQPPPAVTGWRRRVSAWADAAVIPMVERGITIVMQLTTGRRPWLLVASVCALFGIAAGLFATGGIESRTQALA